MMLRTIIFGVAVTALVMATAWWLFQTGRLRGMDAVGMVWISVLLMLVDAGTTWHGVRRIRRSGLLAAPQSLLLTMPNAIRVLAVTSGGISITHDDARRDWVIKDVSTGEQMRVSIRAFPSLPQFLNKHYRMV